MHVAVVCLTITRNYSFDPIYSGPCREDEIVSDACSVQAGD